MKNRNEYFKNMKNMFIYVVYLCFDKGRNLGSFNFVVVDLFNQKILVIFHFLYLFVCLTCNWFTILIMDYDDDDDCPSGFHHHPLNNV